MVLCECLEAIINSTKMENIYIQVPNDSLFKAQIDGVNHDFQKWSWSELQNFEGMRAHIFEEKCSTGFARFWIRPWCKRGALTAEKENLGASVFTASLHKTWSTFSASTVMHIFRTAFWGWGHLFMESPHNPVFSSEGTYTFFPAQISPTFIRQLPQLHYSALELF